jgi:acetylornithine deacetylase/succinyl-diaminopimelate desuccinylase-like protein
VADDWTRAPFAGEQEGDLIFGRGAVDSKGSVAAMLAALEAIAGSGVGLGGSLYFMSDSDGERAFRGAALMSDLKVASRIGTIFSAEATSNERIEIAYPGISTWKITAIGRTAHPTEPERGVNAVAKMAKLVQAVEEGRLSLRRGTSPWFEPRVTTNAIRTRPGGGWSIPATCDAVLSILSPIGVDLTDVRDDIDAFLRTLEAEDGDVRFERKLIPMGGGRLWLRPAEADPNHPGVVALTAAVRAVAGREAKVGPFNGGWVDGAELMGADGSPACLTFGPGDFERAHTVDEAISVREVADAARIYAFATLELLS